MSGTAVKPRLFCYGLRRLTERGSTQDTRGAGRIVSLAQAHLDDVQSLSDCRIADIATALHVSARSLQTSYKQIVGHSMRRTLTAKRIEKAKSLLETTTLPLGEIAEACGVKRFASFAALFRRHVGMTMSSYRNAPDDTDRVHKTPPIGLFD